MNENGPVKVIYIVGWGHSGSTLLDMIIGTSDKVTSVGELVYFNAYYDEKEPEKAPTGFICTCQARFRECSFWSQVLGLLDGRAPKVVQDRSHTERLGWLWRYVKYIASGGRVRPSQEKLGDDEALLLAVKEKASPRVEYICDSSKDFSRLVRLLMMPGVEVYPIYLVRDGRAVAYHYTKKERTNWGLPRKGYYSSLVLWVGVNVISSLILWCSSRPFIRVDYSRFCRDLKAEITRLNECLGLDIRREGLLKKLNETEYHNVGGNYMRFNRITAIREDTKWREKVSGLSYVVGTMLTGLFNRIWSGK